MKLPAPQKIPKVDWQLQFMNVVFLMLMSFLANGTISNIRDSTIEIPFSMLAPAATVGDAAYLDAQNVLRFRGSNSTAEHIAMTWLSDRRNLAGEYAPLPFQIVADRHLSGAMLVARLQEFRAAGIANVILITQREPDRVE
jgi:hypothetical protein